MRKGRHRNKNPKKKKEKFIGSQSFKQFLGRVLPIGIPLLCFGFFFFFLSKSAFQFLTHSPYFAVETVEASSSIRDFTFRDTHLMGSLLDRNIFSVDLQTLEAEVSRKHPELLAVSVSREFPNRIRLDVTPRLPVAEIQGGEHFLVDEEGVILPETHPAGYSRPLAEAPIRLL
ncbi:MAG: FtsQ-type POTRA domain-containing protein [Acidobacteria bacterium]|nr:FtsQ-type POTRA domain-containing protein [Acidobacteriota bacterium]